MKTQHQQRIEKFMELAGQEVPKIPTVPSPEVRILRAKLIWEKTLETIEDLGVHITWEIHGTGGTEFRDTGKFDMEKAVDGCGDLSVVTIGTLSALGVEDEPVLKEVDEANLRKFEPPTCSQCGSKTEYREEAPVGGHWVCLREGLGHRLLAKNKGPYKREDGKWVRSPYFKPADIKKVLENQKAEGVVHPFILSAHPINDRGYEFNKWFPYFTGFLNMPGGTKLNKGHLYEAFVGGWEARINSEQEFKKKSVNPPTFSDEFTKSFNAQDWAKAFLERAQVIPGFIEEGNMVGWFANAIMRGHDEGWKKAMEYRASEELMKRCIVVTPPEVEACQKKYEIAYGKPGGLVIPYGEIEPAYTKKICGCSGADKCPLGRIGHTMQCTAKELKEALLTSQWDNDRLRDMVHTAHEVRDAALAKVPTTIPAPKFKMGDKVDSPGGWFTVGRKRRHPNSSMWEYSTTFGAEWWLENQLTSHQQPISRFSVGQAVDLEGRKRLVSAKRWMPITSPGSECWNYQLDGGKELYPESFLRDWKPQRVHVSVHGDSLKSHRGWWATLDKPEIVKDNYALFIDALPGGVVDEGEVVAVVSPDGQFTFTDHAPIDFGDKARWWKIIYKPEPIK